MRTPQFSEDKKKIMGDISLNSEEGVVRLLLKIDKKYRTKISKELREYGRVMYDQFPWARHVGIEIKDYQRATDLVDCLYAGGLEGVLDVGVDSMTVSLCGDYSGKENY